MIPDITQTQLWRHKPPIDISAVKTARAGLKPMQPMRLHWAPRLRGPRASGGPAPCVWIVVYFCQVLLALKLSRNG